MGGLYDILESYRFQNPKYTYEGLYQDPMSKLATANPLKAIFNPDFEYRSPSFIERFAKEGATNLAGFVPIDYDRAVDFKRLFEDRPLKPTDGAARFKDFNPRVGTITPFQPYENPTYQMKQQLGMVPTGITASSAAATPFGTSVDNIQGFTDKEDFSEPETKTGIAKLLDFLTNFIPGVGLLKRLSDSGGIRSLNQRLRNTDFGQSRTGAEYFMKRRERKQAERAQEAMPDVYRDAKERGFTNERGGFSTNRADRAGTSLGSGQFSPKRSTGRSGY